MTVIATMRIPPAPRRNELTPHTPGSPLAEPDRRSALSYVDDLPVDGIKIDRSFING